MKKFLSIMLVCVLLVSAVPVTADAKESNWAKAYYDYIVQDRYSWDSGIDPEYQLIYLDNNSIPELFVDYIYTYAGSKLLSYYKGNVQSNTLSIGTIDYEAFKNRSYYSGGHMDHYFDHIYKLEKGKLVSLAEGTIDYQYSSNDYKYTWNGKKVTLAKYKQNISKYVNLDITKKTYKGDTEIYDYYGILEYLRKFIITETEEVLQDWAKAYYDFVVADKMKNGGDWQFTQYHFLYLDDDEIPEIYLKYNSYSEGGVILSYRNGEFTANPIALEEIEYEEYGNSFMQVRELKGMHLDQIYKLENTKLVETGFGRYELGTTNYEWNEKSVSKQVYDQNIGDLIDRSNTKSTKDSYINYYNDVIEYLSTFTGGQKNAIKASLSATKLVYNGNKRTPKVTVKDSNGKVLKADADYTLDYSAVKRGKVGRYMIRVTPKKNYTGEKVLYYTIVPKKVTDLSAMRFQYGNKIRLSWKKSTGATGYRIEWKKPGASSYSFLANTTNLYYAKGDLTANKSYAFKVTPYYAINGTKYYGTADTAYATTSIKTVKKGNKLEQVAKPTVSVSDSKVKVKWKNVKNETGYQISQSKSSSGTQIVSTYKTTSGTSKKISASKGVKYYYKVRAYRVVNDKKIYGAWSPVVSYKR